METNNCSWNAHYSFTHYSPKQKRAAPSKEMWVLFATWGMFMQWCISFAKDEQTAPNYENMDEPQKHIKENKERSLTDLVPCTSSAKIDGMGFFLSWEKPEQWLSGCPGCGWSEGGHKETCWSEQGTLHLDLTVPTWVDTIVKPQTLYLNVYICLLVKPQ